MKEASTWQVTDKYSVIAKQDYTQQMKLICLVGSCDVRPCKVWESPEDRR